MNRKNLVTFGPNAQICNMIHHLVTEAAVFKHNLCWTPWFITKGMVLFLSGISLYATTLAL